MSPEESHSGAPPLLFAFVPIVIATVSCILSSAAFAFSRYRGLWVKMLVTKLWNKRRREVLQLDTLNGFFFCMELFLRISRKLLRISAVYGIIVLLVFPVSVALLIKTIGFAICLHTGIVWSIAHRRAAQFESLLFCDGYGIYWRAHGDWFIRERSSRTAFLFTALITITLLALYSIWGVGL